MSPWAKSLRDTAFRFPWSAIRNVFDKYGASGSAELETNLMSFHGIELREPRDWHGTKVGSRT